MSESKSNLKVKLGKFKMDMASLGDTWDACWGDDDLLYVNSDDCEEFSSKPVNNLNKRPGNNLQFHTLYGSSPDKLTGKTINRMAEYGHMTEKGPDGCMWKANGNLCVDGKLYMFVSRHGLNFSARRPCRILPANLFGRVTIRRSCPPISLGGPRLCKPFTALNSSQYNITIFRFFQPCFFKV